MKKLFLIAIGVIISTGVFAQTNMVSETKTTVVKTTETKAVKPDGKYACPKCDHISSKAGKCSHHKMAMVKEGKYYCPMHSNVTSDKAGKCSKCGMGLVKMEMESVEKYGCSKCDWTIPPVKGQCHNSTETKMKDGTLYCVYCHDSAGKCSKCGMEMDKMKIKQKKQKG